MQPANSTESSRQRVERTLRELGIATEVREFGASTRSSAAAAAAIGCSVAQICKSIVFQALDSGRAVVVIASGANRVDEGKVEAAVGEPVGKADASFVRSATGFAIGGVAPVGHLGTVHLLIDLDLFSFDAIWAAAGTPNSVFRLTPQDLRYIPGARALDIKVD